MKIEIVIVALVITLVSLVSYVIGTKSVKTKYTTRLQLLKYNSDTGKMEMDQFNRVEIDIKNKTIKTSNSEMLSRYVMFVGLDENDDE